MAVDTDTWSERLKVERDEGWRELNSSMPWFAFPSSWRIKLIAPFAGAMVRFIVRNEHGAVVSVYLDTLDRLGAVGAPYWEMYQIDGTRTIVDEDDTERFGLHETEKLIEAIGRRGDPVHAARVTLGGE